jgi:hypothetical protein
MGHARTIEHRTVLVTASGSYRSCHCRAYTLLELAARDEIGVPSGVMPNHPALLNAVLRPFSLRRSSTRRSRIPTRYQADDELFSK